MGPVSRDQDGRQQSWGVDDERLHQVQQGRHASANLRAAVANAPSILQPHRAALLSPSRGSSSCSGRLSGQRDTHDGFDRPEWLHPTHPEFPFWPPGSEPFYTNAASERPDFFIPRCSAPNSRQLGPRSTGNRLGPLLSGHFSDTAPHVCRVFAMRASLHSPRISLPAPAAPRSSAASRRKAAGSDNLPPAGASSTWHASPAGLQFSPTAAGDW